MNYMKNLSVTDSFVCTGCDETYPVQFLIHFDQEEACPDCALFWSQDAVKKMRAAELADAERAGEKIAAGYRRAA
jgi:hypothetical protein